jgi:hypothetical protein
MKIMILAAALVAASAMMAAAQTTPAPSTEGKMPAVATPNTKNPTAPVEGANSFTEAQAKDRIEQGGYSGVTGLKLDGKGVWQASATKDGKPVKVSLDYQGNIVAM